MTRRIVALLALVLVPTPPASRGADAPPAAAGTGLLLGQPPADYAARRAALLARVAPMALADGMRTFVGSEGQFRAEPVVVLVGAGAAEDSGKFRQDNDFAYLTGVDVPFAAAILRPGEAGETLYLPPRDPRRERVEGPRPSPGPGAAGRFGFARVESTERFLGDLFAAVGDPLAKAPRERQVSVYLLDPAGDSGTTRASAFAAWLREGLPRTAVRDVSGLVHEQRATKTPAEVALLRRAIAVTAGAFDEVAAAVGPGVPEYALEGRILGAFLRGGSPRPGFPSIVGSGPNATVIHHMKNDRTVGPGDLVVVDIGAEVENYTADITRTFPADGTFTPRQREVYNLVLAAQAAAEAQVKPGETTLDGLTRFVREFFRASPLRAKDEEGNEQTMDAFFVHGLGHHLGMDVHDVVKASAKLTPGAVFTIEPGLYIPSERIGVRIEDDYLVTDQGVEKLSAAIPSDPDEVERWIARGRAAATRP